MALFVMNRYRGDWSDCESGEEQETVTAENNVKKDVREAEQKRTKKVKNTQIVCKVKGESSSGREQDLNLSDSNKETIKKSKKNKRKTDEEDSEVLQLNDELTVSVAEQKMKTRGKKKKDVVKIAESELKTSDANTTKKKRKCTDKIKPDAKELKKVKLKDTDTNLDDIKDKSHKLSNVDETSQETLDDTKDVSESNEPKDGKKKRRGLTQERGGFMVLGKVQEKSKPKVKRTLPDWIRTPYIVSPDLLLDQQPLTSIPNLDPHLLDTLRANNIHHFFPVQLQVIPAILNDSLHGLYVGRAGSRPGDVCCSAPTGSGKTLSFVIPIVQLLEKRVVPQIRCLVLLPVIELATQVYSVFTTYARPTNIKIALLSGQKSFSVEQAEIVKKIDGGYKSMVDIIVTTPGRLVDHISSTPGFDLRHLRYLVIDEADRMISELKQDWLVRLQEAVYSTNQMSASVTNQYPEFSRSVPGHMTSANNMKMETPLQKLVFSATLSLNPEILQQLDLFHPRLYTSIKHASIVQPLTHARSETKGNESLEKEELIGALVKPAGLKEYYSVVRANEKPLAIVHLIKNLGYTNVLCFTTSIQSAHRLCLVLKKLGRIKAMEMSSNKTANARSKTLEKFVKGHLDMLVCTDTMARGMDLENVDYVVSYDIPHHQLTYLHRVGRTARAGREGTAITLVLPKEVNHYKSLLHQNGDKAVKLELDKQKLSELAPSVEAALQKTALIIERKSRSSRTLPKSRNTKTNSTARRSQGMSKTSSGNSKPKPAIKQPDKKR